MRPYLSGREFYALNTMSQHYKSLSSLRDRYLSLLHSLSVEANQVDFYYTLRRVNKFNLSLLVVRCLLSKSANRSIQATFLLRLLVFESRLASSPFLSLSQPFNLSQPFLTSYDLHIVAPVCPDYSYDRLKDGTYRYTFSRLGGGIGLVAQKAIKNLNLLESITHDLQSPFFNVKFSVLVGDFEASPTNCSRLGETQESFLAKIDSSVASITTAYPHFNPARFTDICGGLSAWLQLQRINSTLLSISSFDSLIARIPLINHERTFISRLPLYKRWLGEGSDFTQAFTDQAIEYISMGYLITRRFGNNSFSLLVASDHRAMRPYYNVLSQHATCGSSASY